MQVSVDLRNAKSNLHINNIEEKLIKMWDQTVPIPGNDTKLWSRGAAQKKCHFEIRN